MPENPFAEDDEFRVPGVWTPEEGAAGEKYVTRKEFAQYVAALNQHGVMAVNSTEDAPHPDMRVRSLRWGVTGVLSEDGAIFPSAQDLVFKMGATGLTDASVIRWAPDPIVVPTLPEAYIYASRISGDPYLYFFVDKGGSSSFARAEAGDNGTDGYFDIAVQDSAAALGTYSFGASQASFYKLLAVPAVFFDSLTSDPGTLSEGALWYRSDLDKFRARVQTTTYNVALEGGPQILGDFSELTIASGVITVTTSAHTVDTEADAGTDDLDTINGGTNGQILVLQAIDGAHTVVCKDFTGNLLLAGDFSMDSSSDTITLIRNGSFWRELCRSDNGA